MRSAHAVAALLAAFAFACSAAAPEDDGLGDDEGLPRDLGEDDYEGSGDGEGEELSPSRPRGGTAPEGTTPKPPETEPPAATNTCDTARDAGALSGDTASPNVTTQGTCSEWISVRVREDQSSFLGVSQRVTVTLVPPTGADFDLFVYSNATADVPECSVVSGKSDQKGDKSESVKLEWGEVGAGNNADDSRTLNIHVKSKTGKCAAKTWTLLVQGNQ